MSGCGAHTKKHIPSQCSFNTTYNKFRYEYNYITCRLQTNLLTREVRQVSVHLNPNFRESGLHTSGLVKKVGFSRKVQFCPVESWKKINNQFL